MIHTVLADDEVLARQKLRQLLRNEPEIDVVGEGATASETIDLVRATKPQLLEAMQGHILAVVQLMGRYQR